MYGVFVRILTERSQRKAFLQARNCIEDRLRLEDENEKQVSVSSARRPFGQLCPVPAPLTSHSEPATGIPAGPLARGSGPRLPPLLTKEKEEPKDI